MKYIIFFASLSTILFLGCRKDLEINNKSLDFSISQDSIFINNVYTGTKSPVYSLMIKNKSNHDILIPSIALKQNESKVILNINGRSGQFFNDIPLLKNDSMRILMHIVAEDILNSKYYEDAIIFSNQNNEKKEVTILSFFEKSKIYYSNQDLIFTNNQALLDSSTTHIFYKDLEVPENSVLKIEAGSRLRFFNHSSLKLNPGSILQAKGNPEHRIILKGFRNEIRYDSLPGQWQGISSNNAEIHLNSTVIQGAKTGINAKNSELNINQSLIINSSVYGVNAEESSLQLINSVIFNAGETALFIKKPLSSNITFSTILNPWNSNVTGISGQNLPFEIQDYTNVPFNVVNSIFYGQSPNGIKIPQGDLDNLKFEYNLIKNNRPEDLNLNLPIFSNTIIDEPLFESILFSNPNLSLKENSPAKNKGKFLQALKKDINNQNRGNPPSLGAYK